MKVSKVFDLPVSAGEHNMDSDSIYGASGNGEWCATFCSDEQAKVAANCINHADALADALEAITSDYNRYAATHPVDMTDDDNAKLHGIMFNASQSLRLYRGAK